MQKGKIVDVAAAIVAKDLSKVFRRKGGEEIVALDGVTLTAGAGEITAITGASGAGKTTLFQVLAGLEGADSGSVRLTGEDLAGMRAGARTRFRRRNLGFVFQSFNLLPNLTARDNILLPLRLDGAALEETRLAELADRLGINARLGHRPGELSAGQQQCVAVARALLTEPEVVIADEPTSALDGEATAMLLDLMGELARERGRSFVLATHDPAVLARADRVYHLAAGRVVAPPKARM